jgi:hypothetical protein
MLQARWGRPIEAKPDLVSYFKKHELPPADWEGWLPQVDMEEVKVKMIKNESLDTSEFGYYPSEVDTAMQAPWAFPQYQKHSGLSREQIQDQLSSMGVRDIDIQFETVPAASSGYDINLVHDRRQNIRQVLGSAIG